MNDEEIIFRRWCPPRGVAGEEVPRKKDRFARINRGKLPCRQWKGNDTAIHPNAMELPHLAKKSFNINGIHACN